MAVPSTIQWHFAWPSGAFFAGFRVPNPLRGLKSAHQDLRQHQLAWQ